MNAAPDAVPLVARDGRDVLFRAPGRDFTASDFVRDAERLAAQLPGVGHVFNLCQDRYWFTVGLAAALLRGQVSLLTSDRSPERLRALAARFGAVASIGQEDGPVSPFAHVRVGGLREAESREGAAPILPADQPAAIVFTSGSTGEPVGTEKSWGTLAGRSIAGGARFGMRAEAPVSVVGTVPPWHMYGFETTALLPLHAGCASWCAPLFYPPDVRDALAAVPAPRVLVTTPLQLRALVQSGTALPPLAAVISATAPLDPALAAETEARWATQLLEIFGATEVGSIASRRTVLGPDWTLYDGVRLEQDEAGPVRVLAPPAPPGTLADVVELTGAGAFRLIGRADDVLKLGGRRASLAGLNRLLNDIPGVADGVFLPPEDDDERPTARMQAFVIAPERSSEEILAELRERIDHAFLPRRVIRVDRLPRNEVGKLPREALRSLEKRGGG